MNILENLDTAVQYISNQCSLKPKVGVVLGSGLGAFVNEVQIEKQIPFSEIPHFIPPTVDGHGGQLILGHCNDTPISILSGRVHYYEGHSMSQVVFPVRTLAMLGIEYLILTNSAGGLKPDMKSGDFMIIEDHINLMGNTPLMGPNLKQLGPRFPDMTQAYDSKLIKKMETLLQSQNIRHHKGIYCAVSGPTYETPAEVRYLQMIGGSAVGMSTVPETIAANHLGLKVSALSCITNLAAGISTQKLSHEEVTEEAQKAQSSFCRLLADFVKNI